MPDLRDELLRAGRERQLRYMAWAIHGFTVMARDPDIGDTSRARINNLIHYLAGHLAALTDPDQPFTEERATSVLDLTQHLNARLADDLRMDLSRQD